MATATEHIPNSKKSVADVPQYNEDLPKDLEHANTHGTYLDPDEASHLTAEHRQYLLQRHGTLELDPLPTMGDADPYNWPTWKVRSVMIYELWTKC